MNSEPLLEVHGKGLCAWRMCTMKSLASSGEVMVLSSPGLLQVKVWMNSGSRGQGQKSRGWPRLVITLGVQETDWVQ